MAKQMRITGPQFGEFVDCTLAAEKYLSLLVAARHVSDEARTAEAKTAEVKQPAKKKKR
jgi:hypothetical protein